VAFKSGDAVKAFSEDGWYRGKVVCRCKLRSGERGYGILLEIGRYIAVPEDDVEEEGERY